MNTVGYIDEMSPKQIIYNKRILTNARNLFPIKPSHNRFSFGSLNFEMKAIVISTEDALITVNDLHK